MILADTSAWVEYLRATGSPEHGRMRDLIADDGELVTTEVVVMELLAGAGDEERTGRLRRLLARYELLPLAELADFEDAASIYRACRRGGDTVRSLSDCLIAAVAIRVSARLLGRDRDFDVIARHAPLMVLDGS